MSVSSWMDKQLSLQAWPGEDESIHGCRTNTMHCPALALLAPALLWEFCELPAPCTGSTHHGPLVLQVVVAREGCTHRPGYATAWCAPRDAGTAGCEGQSICTSPVTTLGDNWPKGPPCSAHEPCQHPSVSLSQLGLLCAP